MSIYVAVLFIFALFFPTHYDLIITCHFEVMTLQLRTTTALKVHFLKHLLIKSSTI